MRLRWYLFKTSHRVRLSGVAIIVVCVAAVVAERQGALPDPVPVFVGAIALIGMMVAVLAAAWAKPPDTASGVKNAVVARNASAGIATALIVWMAMFSLGRLTVGVRTLLPALVMTAEFVAMAFLAHRAAWYGRNPDARKRLLEQRDAATRARKAAALEAIAERRAEQATQEFPAVHLVEVDQPAPPPTPPVVEPEPADPEHAAEPEAEETSEPAATPPRKRWRFGQKPESQPEPMPQREELVAPVQPIVPQSPRPATRRDPLDLIDLTGGDDYFGDPDDDPVAGELLDRNNNRV